MLQHTCLFKISDMMTSYVWHCFTLIVRKI